MKFWGDYTPKPQLSPAQAEQALRLMTAESVVSTAMFSVTSSGLLAAYALALGASNLQIGVLAAIPFITQPMQIPAILLVERLRRRKLLTVALWLPAQLLWIPAALVPLLIGAPGGLAVTALLLCLGFRGALVAMVGCAWDSWSRDLVPRDILGRYYSRQMALALLAAVAFGLSGAFFMDFWRSRHEGHAEILGYTLVILSGAMTLGLAGPWFISRMVEPQMPPRIGAAASLRRLLAAPFRDRNYRRLLAFLFCWSFAADLAIPFFTVYMLKDLGYPLALALGLNTARNFTNAVTLGLWGRLADHAGGKTVMAMGASLYLLVFLGWIFAAGQTPHAATLPMVVALQIFAGVAAGAVNLTVGTLSLKLAPQQEATAYLVGASLAGSVGASLGPLAGGALADHFRQRQLSLSLTWTEPAGASQWPALHFGGFDFLFGLAFLAGALTLPLLRNLEEEGAGTRQSALAELLQPSARLLARLRALAPGLPWLASVSLAYLRYLPGLDVAAAVAVSQTAAALRWLNRLRRRILFSSLRRGT